MASLKVYGKTYSTNVTRVLTTLAEKNVDDYQMVPIDLLTGANKTPEYLKLQPFGQIPVFQDGDFALYGRVPSQDTLATSTKDRELRWQKVL